MSDEEEYSEEEIEEEVEEPEQPAAVETEAQPETEETEEVEEEETEAEPESKPQAESNREDAPTLKKAPKQEAVAAPAELSEAEQAMLNAKQRHEQEEAAKILDSEARRKQEIVQVDQELVELKQRQEERKRERAEEERVFAEKRRQDDERRRADEQTHKEKIEAEKAKRENEKLRRQQAMSGAFVGGLGAAAPGRNFVITKKEGGQTSAAPTEGGKKRGKTAEEIASEKSNYMSIVNRPVDVSNLLPNDLKNKIKQLHAKIVRLESEKYDLSKRSERQEYDLKELGERESQRARNKALALGVEVEQQEGKVRPPKINVASKFDRQVDRRSYQEKYTIYEKPYVKPNPSIARGTARPPPEWGRKNNDELENLRKVLEPPKYVEQAPIEGAKPPVKPIPLQLPSSDFADEPGAQEAPKEEAAPVEPPAKPAKKAGRA